MDTKLHVISLSPCISNNIQAVESLVDPLRKYDGNFGVIDNISPLMYCLYGDKVIIPPREEFLAQHRAKYPEPDLEQNTMCVLVKWMDKIHPSLLVGLADLACYALSKTEHTMIVATHNFFFLEALDVYSKKHGIGHRSQFYNAHGSGKLEELDPYELERMYEPYAGLASHLEIVRSEI